MFQAIQNLLHGMGAIAGAAFGGYFTDRFGWRSCFLMQLPISLLALGVGSVALSDPIYPEHDGKQKPKVDMLGSGLLVSGLALQLTALNLGSNGAGWFSAVVLGLFGASATLLGSLIYVEMTTTAIPVMPLHLFCGTRNLCLTAVNVLLGFTAYMVCQQDPSSVTC